MTFINTATDLAATEASPERTAFLTNLLNDYSTFDDAKYPENYNYDLQKDDEGYIEPVIRKEWNAGAAAYWGFNSRGEIEAMLEGKFPYPDKEVTP